MALRLLHIGFGGWGLDWTRIVRNTPEVEVVGIADMNETALGAARLKYGLPEEAAFLSLEGALAALEPEAVLITAGAAVHAPLALTALAAGAHVLVEKPFAPTLAEAEGVVAAAKAQNRVLMVSQNYRHFPAPRAVRDLVTEGAIGTVGSVYVDFRVDMAGRLSAGHPYFSLYEPLLLDMAIHHFDLMRFTLSQEPLSVACSSWNPPESPFTYAPAASATVTLDGGAAVAYRGSWLSAPQTCWAGEWRLEGTKGRITWTSRRGGVDDLSGERVTLRGRKVTLPTPERTGRRGVLTEFAGAVAGGGEPLSSGVHNLKTLALTLGAIASASEGRRLALG